ncbi:hypothetical protein [Priestia megaterium]|uniref:hypothetical protein n=1 Tax=Priestia megaterium TaxID=1404 RepID=UPI0016569928|nr:hypothetical protein [Priestia megaterium]
MIKIKKYYAHYNPKDGMYYVDKSYPYKKKKSTREKGNLVEFDYANGSNPISPLVPGPGGLPLPQNVATVRLNEVKAGNVVYLNGLFHINNDNTTGPQDLVVSIHKGSTPTEGNLIYRKVIEIDVAQNIHDDITEVSVQYVDDNFRSNQTDVRYILTAAQRVGTGLFLLNPITFTAMEIKGPF